jgi:hypothetical protein
MRTELYFGLGRVGEPGGITEAAWTTFLDEVVTPRFPDGFSQFDAYGQWRSMKREGAPIVRLRSRVIVVLHPETAASEAAIEGIRADFKKRFGHESVLRATQPAAVAF